MHEMHAYEDLGMNKLYKPVVGPPGPSLSAAPPLAVWLGRPVSLDCSHHSAASVEPPGPSLSASPPLAVWPGRPVSLDCSHHSAASVEPPGPSLSASLPLAVWPGRPVSLDWFQLFAPTGPH